MASASLNLPYTVFGALLIAAIVSGTLIIYPRVQELNQLKAEAAATEAKITERQAFLQTIDRKRVELDRNSTHERELNVVLPAEDTITDQLRIIERSATQTGVAVQQVTNNSTSGRAVARSAQQRGDFNYLPPGVLPTIITVSANGNYLQWRQFIQQLEASIRLMDLPKLTLTASTTDPNILDGTLTIQTYLIEPANIVANP